MPARGLRSVRPRKAFYRTPPGIRYAGRPTDLANPFERRPRDDRSFMFGQARAWKLHRRWLLGQLGALSLERLAFSPSEIDALARMRQRVLRLLPHLRGQTLQCWCSLRSRWCHVDTLIQLANRVAA